MKGWEYKVVKLAAAGWLIGGNVDTSVMERDLDKLGADGWELATGFDTNQAGGMSREVILILKRQANG